MGLLDRGDAETNKTKWRSSSKENSFSCQHEERCKDKPVQRCELADSQFPMSVTISSIASSSPGARQLLTF